MTTSRLALLALCILFRSATGQITMICNFASEPTFGEIFELISPVDIPDISVDKITKSGNSVDEVILKSGGSVLSRIIQTIANAKFPLGFLISDGVYELDLLKYQPSFPAIELLQKKPLSQQVTFFRNHSILLASFVTIFVHVHSCFVELQNQLDCQPLSVQHVDASLARICTHMLLPELATTFNHLATKLGMWKPQTTGACMPTPLGSGRTHSISSNNSTTLYVWTHW
jgi:hypothetical protein